jgi:hypothetical protein
MKHVYKLIFLLLLTSCSTLSGHSPRAIFFADIEKLEIEKTTQAQILQTFGKPSKVSFRSKSNEAWVYDGILPNGATAQKASFSFKDGILVGALWIPYESDAFQNIETLQNHFKGMKFIREVEGWDKKGHSYSNDANYYDLKSGVSFTVDGYHNSVTMIGLAAPTSNRNLSSQKNK